MFHSPSIKHLEDEKAKLLKAKPETERKPESEPQPEPQSNQEQEQDQEPRINLDVESSSEATNEKPEDKTKLSFTQKVVKFVKGFFWNLNSIGVPTKIVL